MPSLERMFWEEPMYSGIDSAGGTAKEAILNALATLNSGEARDALLDILSRLLQRDFARACDANEQDYVQTVACAIRALQHWGDHADVREFLADISVGSSWPDKACAPMQEAAFEVLVVGDMKRQRLSTDHARAMFLLDQLTGSGAGHASDWTRPGLKTPQAARNAAIINLMVGIGPSVIPLMDACQRHGQPSDPSRQEAYRRVKSRLEANDRYRRLQGKAQR